MTPYYSPNNAYEKTDEYKAFVKRKQEILKNVEKLLLIKFPDDLEKRRKYKEGIEEALMEEEETVKTETKKLKNRKSSIMIRKK